MALPVALQLFSVRDEIECDLEGTLRKIKEIGYDGIETCYGSYGMDPAEFRALCNGIGLKIISNHLGTDAIIKETEESLEFYKKLGVPYVAISGFWGDYRYGEKDYTYMIKELDRCSAIFKENGIQVLYHNHDWEFIKHDGKYALDCIFADTTDDNLLPQIDVCWATVGHGNGADYLRRYKGRCPLVHLKDFYTKEPVVFEENGYTRPKDFEFRPIGYGRVDMVDVLIASEEIGAEWVIVEQDTSSLSRTPLECAEISRNWLRTLGW